MYSEKNRTDLAVPILSEDTVINFPLYIMIHVNYYRCPEGEGWDRCDCILYSILIFNERSADKSKSRDEFRVKNGFRSGDLQQDRLGEKSGKKSRSKQISHNRQRRLDNVRCTRQTECVLREILVNECVFFYSVWVYACSEDGWLGTCKCA